jgi:hypothetical protein
LFLHPKDGKWYVGEILSVDSQSILVHFVGWTSRWDIWIRKENFGRIAPLHTYTSKLTEVEKMSCMSRWRVVDVCRFISVDLELPQYERAFREMSVDGDMLAQLSKEELASELGVDIELHRKKILTKIDKWKKIASRVDIPATLIIEPTNLPRQ